RFRCASPPVIHDVVPAGLKIKTLTKNELDIKKIPLNNYKVSIVPKVPFITKTEFSSNLGKSMPNLIRMRSRLPLRKNEHSSLLLNSYVFLEVPNDNINPII
ncbi:MAG: hypothetical protein LBC02_13615, partial [Planctomycetaceae bacterium]|nr:hypothetical protein [Planctomycetaceae bacterium]